MKKNILKSTALLFVFLFFVTIMSSCNKGYGCPNQFKVTKVTSNI